MKISLAMIVKNEEKYISRCIESVQHLVDEIIVVDTGSTDNTLELLDSYPKVQLFTFDWQHDFAAARNYSIEQTTGDYILVLDADEYVTRGKKKDLLQIAHQQKIGKIQIVSLFENNGETAEASTTTSRFFPRDVVYRGRIHEQLVSDLSRIESKIVVKHSGYYQTDKTERNMTLLTKELEQHENDAYYLYQLGKEWRNKQNHKEAFTCFTKATQYCLPNDNFFPQLVTELINSGKEAKQYKFTLQVINAYEQQLDWYPDFHFAIGLFYLDYSLYKSSSDRQTATAYLMKIKHSFNHCLELGEKHATIKGTGSFLAHYNLGVYHEVIQNTQQAKLHYQKSSQFGYTKAIDRLRHI